MQDAGAMPCVTQAVLSDPTWAAQHCLKYVPPGFKCLWIPRERSYGLCRSPPGLLKNVWLLRGLSGIGPVLLDRWVRFKCLTSSL